MQYALMAWTCGQGPELHLDVSEVWTTRALAAPQLVYTTGAIAAPGRVYTTKGPELHPACLHYRGLCCIWTCLLHRNLSCTCICLGNTGAFAAPGRVYTTVPEFIDPRFRENKPKTLVVSHWKRAFSACFRENWVYNFRHRGLTEQNLWRESQNFVSRKFCNHLTVSAASVCCAQLE